MRNTDEATVQRGSAEAKRWAHQRSGEFGEAVKRVRDACGISASELAKRTEALGFPITRGTIAKIEGNHRAGKIDLAEVVVLSAALNVPPVLLLFPQLPTGDVDVLPGAAMIPAGRAVGWFIGESTLRPGASEMIGEGASAAAVGDAIDRDVDYLNQAKRVTDGRRWIELNKAAVATAKALARLQDRPEDEQVVALKRRLDEIVVEMAEISDIPGLLDG